MNRLHSGASKWAGLAVLAGILSLAQPAQGSEITGIVSFGDSLSDVGNYYAATGGASPPPPYTPGEFTNGLNWVQYLAQDLGVAAPTASSSGGTDYAYGGAMTGTGYTSSTFLGATASVPNTGQQIATYLASNTPTSGQLFTLWAGANDLLHSATPNPIASADNVASEVATLANAGATQIIVGNLPMLGDLPYIKQTEPAAIQQGLDLMSMAFNAELQSDLAGLQGQLKAQIHLLDVNSLVNDAIANPSKYGFTDVTDYALMYGPNGQGFLSWDGIHPTTQADAFIGALAAQTVPEPSSWVLFATSIVGIGAWASRRRTRSSSTSR